VLAAAWGRRPGSPGAAKEEGESLRGPRGTYSPSYHGRRRREGVARRGPAGGGGGARGGGSESSGRRRAVVGEFVGVEEILSLPSPWAEKQRGGVATVPAEVSGGGYGGSTAGPGRGRAVAGELVKVVGGAMGLFIGRARRGEGRGAMDAGQRARRPLMALGVGVASRSGGAIRDCGTEQRDGSGRGRAARRASWVRVERVGIGRACMALLAGGC
jgi:hypothetical protein